MIRKRFHLDWIFECPDAVLACSALRYKNKEYLIFGGHDKILYLMDTEEGMQIMDEVTFDGWVRCIYPIDLDRDNNQEILVGSGDGSFIVVKIDTSTDKFVGILRYHSKGKVLCCTAGSFSNYGEIKLFFGGEDKTLKIFNSIDSKNPDFILYYDSWVTVCSVGYLKLPDTRKPELCLLVGTKSGILQLIRMIEGKPDIYWQRDFNSQINVIQIGDVAHDGYNEIVLGTDDSYIKIIDSLGKNLRYIKVRNGRPLSIVIDDVDGDNANEIIAGCADGALKVYENTSKESTDFRLKWKTKVSTSIKDMFIVDDSVGGIKHIIFGGYDRTIRQVTDFEWGKKPTLDIPKYIEPPKVSKAQKRRDARRERKFKPIPTNIRGFVKEIFKRNRFLNSLNILKQELRDIGYSDDIIKNEIEILKSENKIKQVDKNLNVWIIDENNVSEIKKD